MLGKINLFPLTKLLKMAELVLKHNALEFDGTVKEQISGNATRTKCLPSYACIFMSKLANVCKRISESQQNKPLV